MKYPIYILPNQTSEQVVIQGSRETLQRVIDDFSANLSNRRILNPLIDKVRQGDSGIVRVTMSREDANSLLDMVGLSY